MQLLAINASIDYNFVYQVDMYVYIGRQLCKEALLEIG